MINLNKISDSIDALAQAISPSWAAARMRDRAVMRAMSSPWRATDPTGVVSKNLALPHSQSQNDLLDGRLQDLRDDSHSLLRDNPLCRAICTTRADLIVGSGIRYQPALSAEALALTDDEALEIENVLQNEFECWSASCGIACEALPDLLHQLSRAEFEAGEVFIFFPRISNNGRYRLKVQLIEADLIQTPTEKLNDANVIDGIERDKNGIPVAVYVAITSQYGTVEGYRRISFRDKDGNVQLIQYFDIDRPGQAHGIPKLAGVSLQARQLDKFLDSYTTKAVIESFYTTFIHSDSQFQVASTSNTAQGEQSYDLGPGSVIRLLPGEDVKFAHATSPGETFSPFVAELTKFICSGCGFPAEIVLKSFGSSYSASRGNLNECWRLISRERRRMYGLLNTIAELFISELVDEGLVDLPGFVDDFQMRRAYLGAVWSGDARGSLDPLQEARADAVAEAMCWTTGTANAASRGNDIDRNINGLRRERQMKEKAGIPAMYDKTLNLEDEKNDKNDENLGN
jgi:lambda family phage portal protein